MQLVLWLLLCAGDLRSKVCLLCALSALNFGRLLVLWLVGATDFDGLAASNSDAEESDDTLPSRTDDFFDNLGGSGHCADTILAGAGLTVY